MMEERFGPASQYRREEIAVSILTQLEATIPHLTIEAQWNDRASGAAQCIVSLL
jgi:hypothetical protein